MAVRKIIKPYTSDEAATCSGSKGSIYGSYIMILFIMIFSILCIIISIFATQHHNFNNYLSLPTMISYTDTTGTYKRAKKRGFELS